MIHRFIHYLAGFIILTIANLQALYSQTILGKVVFNDSCPLEFANIILLNKKDSLLIDQTASEASGTFLLRTGSKGQKIIRISYVGFQTQYLDVEIDSDSLDIGNVLLKENENLINEVVVTALVPIFTRQENRLVVNVNSTLLSSSGTAIDVIRQIPGISVRENQINIFTKGSPIIYIDDRKLHDQQELQHLRSNDIETIELITSPEAKYDAESKAVLLIKTKKRQERWAIQTSTHLKQGHHLSNNEDFGFIYNQNKISFFATYHQNTSKYLQDVEALYTIYSDTWWQYLLKAPQTHKNEANTLTAGLDWLIRDKQSLGVQYKGVVRNRNIKSNDRTYASANEIMFDSIITRFQSKEKSTQHLVNAFYIAEYSKKFNMRLDLDYLNVAKNNHQQNEESSSWENRNITVRNKSNYSLCAGKLTFTYSPEENNRLEFGTEYDRIEGSGSLISAEEYVVDKYHTNQEKKSAAFITYRCLWRKWNFQLGIRYEYVHLRATEDSIKREKTNRQYYGFYPTLGFSGKIGKTQMGLELSQKIRRPSFSLLNDNSYYINPFLLEKGNPYLQEESIFQINYYLTGNYFDLNLGYTYQKNPIADIISAVENQASQLYLTTINYPKHQNLNVLFSSNFSYKIWTPRLTVGLDQPFFSVSYQGKMDKREQLFVFFQFFNDIVLPKDYIVSVNFEYAGKNNEYVIANSKYKYVDLGVRKYFLDKKLLIHLEATDIFQWAINDRSEMNINSVSYLKKKIRETCFINLKVSYQMYDSSKKYRGKAVNKDDIDRL